jgi:hypothetical protein
VGNRKKATQLLSSKGIADVSQSLDEIQSRYPKRETSIIETIDTNLFTPFTEDSIPIMISILNKKPWGSSTDAHGLSFDNLKNLCRTFPDSTKGLLKLINFIASGRAQSVEFDRLLKQSRGIPLNKSESGGIRPIAIVPCITQLVASMLTKRHRGLVSSTCGPCQFGGEFSGGTESLPHTVRLYKDAHPDHVILQRDVKNAFNSGYQHLMLDALHHVPDGKGKDLVPFVHWLFSGSFKVMYTDFSQEEPITHEIEHERGVPQGLSISSMIFNISQKYCLSNLPQDQDITELYLHDDSYIMGPADKVLQRYEAVCKELQNLGLEHNPQKSNLFSPYQLSDDDKTSAAYLGINLVGPLEGLIVAGSPIGDKDWTLQQVNNQVNEIINNIEILKMAISHASNNDGITVMTSTSIARLCIPSSIIYLLRTTPPEFTLPGAQLLDNALKDFLLEITNSTQLLPSNINEREKVFSRIFAPIQHGGMGIQSSEDSCHSAYISSLLLTAPLISLACPDLFEKVSNLPNSCSQSNFSNCIIHLQGKGIKTLDEINWTSLQQENGYYSKFQQKLSRELHKQIKVTKFAPPSIPPSSGLFAQHVPINISEERCRLIGQSSRTAGAWLTAPTSSKYCQMNKSAFNTAYQMRLGLNIFPSGTKCKCCKKVIDPIGNHIMTCSNHELRNKARNPTHAAIKREILSILASDLPIASFKIGKSEPKLNEFFEPNMPAVTGFRSDIHIKNLHPSNGESPNMLIDVTIAHPGSKEYVHKYEKAGYAGDCRSLKKRLEASSRFKISDETIGKFTVFGIDSYGGFGSEAYSILQDIAKICSSKQTGKSYSDTINFYYQRVSVALQTARAMQLEIMRSNV